MGGLLPKGPRKAPFFRTAGAARPFVVTAPLGVTCRSVSPLSPLCHEQCLSSTCRTA
jgi:hypothetical protein